MTGRLECKVAFITGIARGQGRAHAIRLAQEGADIIGVDIADQIDTVPFAMGTQADLEETVRLVEHLDRRIVVSRSDVRDLDALTRAIDDGVSKLGRLDIVVANAGISSFGRMDEITEEAWRDVVDVNLTGVWHTVKASVPHLRAAGGGSIILTSSGAGLRAIRGASAYVAAKHGVVGIMRAAGLEYAADSIRVNSVHPTTTDTPMIQNPTTRNLFLPGVAEPTREQFAEAAIRTHALPVPWVEPVDISNAVLWLASDEARYVTGVALPVDAGQGLL